MWALVCRTSRSSCDSSESAEAARAAARRARHGGFKGLWCMAWAGLEASGRGADVLAMPAGTAAAHDGEASHRAGDSREVVVLGLRQDWRQHSTRPKLNLTRLLGAKEALQPGPCAQCLARDGWPDATEVPAALGAGRGGLAFHRLCRMSADLPADALGALPRLQSDQGSFEEDVSLRR